MMNDNSGDEPGRSYRDHPEVSLSREFSKSWPVAIFGLLLVCGGSYLLFWNEGRAIKTSMALEEGLRHIR